jgi:hypothetical protein
MVIVHHRYHEFLYLILEFSRYYLYIGTAFPLYTMYYLPESSKPSLGLEEKLRKFFDYILKVETERKRDSGIAVVQIELGVEEEL